MKKSADILHNVTNTPPTVNDDSSKGYSVGSRWVDAASDKLWVCYDTNVGAAVWRDQSDRTNHTGTQTASTISDFDTEVSNNTDVAANTAKVSNATHTGEVTGSTALTVDPTAVSNKANKATLAGTEKFLIEDGGVLKHVLASDVGGSIYTTNGNIGSGRIATITDTLTFTGGQTTLRGADLLSP